MVNPVSVTREITAGPERVWGLIVDLPRMGEWSPENMGGEWVKGVAGPALGASFKGRNKNGKKSWSTKVRINGFDVPKRFSFGLMVVGKNWCDWVYEIEPTESGSRVTHSWVDHRGALSTSLGKVISGVADRAPHNRANMEITLANLAKAAESS